MDEPFTPEQEARLRELIAEMLQQMTAAQIDQIIAQIQAQTAVRR